MRRDELSPPYIESEESYRHILAQDPNHDGAHHFLGVLALRAGRFDAAIEHLHRAVEIQPSNAAYLINLGTAFAGQKRLDDAISCFRRALELTPEIADAHNNLGVALQQQGQLDEAVASYRRALELRPEFADAHKNLANALSTVAATRAPIEKAVGYFIDSGIELRIQGKVDEAIACYRRALEQNPGSMEAHYNLGEALQAQGKLDSAAASYRRALELSPDYSAAHNNLGNVLRDQGKLPEAHASFCRALELKPESVVAHINLGNVLRDLDRPEEALACWRRALELKPGFAEAHNNLASVLQDQKKFDEALAHYRQAFELKPEYAEARSNWSLLTLLRGDFERGWPEYEWRLLAMTPQRAFAQPRWDGSSLAGRTILLHAEQGFGDTIQFIRYIELVAQSGGRVIVECQKRLGRLLRGSLAGFTVVEKGEPAPSFDVQCALLSLPMVFRTTLQTIPQQVPYLFADANAVTRWRDKIAHGTPSFNVGLAWAGNKTHKNDRKRSLKLEALAPLGRVPGVRFYSLQKGDPAQQALMPPPGMQIIDWTNELDDFADTAALVANLDLVIAVDTAVAHLAGALGIPVWTLLPFAPDWRWLLDRDDSPWYPTMRLFRQTVPGDWDSVIEVVCDALRRTAGQSLREGIAETSPPRLKWHEAAAALPRAAGSDESKKATETGDTNFLVENGHVRLKRCRHGLMLYLANDRYVGRSLDRYGEFSESETKLFQLFVRPGWNVLEIGANMGAHTPTLAKMVGTNGLVHAFEPQRVIFQILCANIALNALSNVYTHHTAVGRTAGTVAVPKLDYTAINNFGGLSLGDAPQTYVSPGDRIPDIDMATQKRRQESEIVSVMTVDSMNLRACDMLKIDVEGMEGAVIAGAEKTIARFRPVLYVENDRDNQAAALIQQLLALDYRLYWHFPPLFNPDNYFRQSENVFGRVVSINMLGLHRSFAQNIEGLREITCARDTWRAAE